jgi:hypothetical protein
MERSVVQVTKPRCVSVVSQDVPEIVETLSPVAHFTGLDIFWLDCQREAKRQKQRKNGYQEQWLKSPQPSLAGEGESERWWSGQHGGVTGLRVFDSEATDEFREVTLVPPSISAIRSESQGIDGCEDD